MSRNFKKKGISKKYLGTHQTTYQVLHPRKADRLPSRYDSCATPGPRGDYFCMKSYVLNFVVNITRRCGRDDSTPDGCSSSSSRKLMQVGSRCHTSVLLVHGGLKETGWVGFVVKGGRRGRRSSRTACRQGRHS
jgi:hypothetical protein